VELPAPRAHAFVADLEAPVLEDTDRHHLERVLRLRRGDAITISDGRGGLRRCRFDTALEPLSETEHRPSPPYPLAVAFALTKGERPEWVVQKLTELGVDRVAPFIASRSVVRWDAGRAAKNEERLRRVAREAAMQSRRVWLPSIDAVTTFRALADHPHAALADAGGRSPRAHDRLLLVGPEGGWAEEERAAVDDRVGLGPQVLRAETAAIVAGVVLCGIRSRVVAPSAPDHIV
jgi:16S rRNA (uracil1498-N3)-methyltransferase